MTISMRQLFGAPRPGKPTSLRRSLEALRVKSLRAARPNQDDDDAPAGGVAGPIGVHYRALGGTRGPLGPVLSKNTRVAGGEIVFFKYGMLWTGARPGVVLYADASLPLMGRPLLVAQPPASICSLVTSEHNVAGLKPQQEASAEDVVVLHTAVADRLFLNPVGEPIGESTLVPLIGRERAGGITFSLSKSQLDRVRDRQLYDIVLGLPDGSHSILSPHSVYLTSTTWKDFSFAHVTDIHVAARIDTMHAELRRLAAAGKVAAKALASFNNFNDNFCDFIRYANRLHARGEIDFILATGDLVDYLFEERDHRREGGGNFAVFKSIVLGRRQSSDGRPGEELRVPLFTTLGNHDYRSNPYRLINSIAITASDVAGDGIFGSFVDFIGLGGAGIKIKERAEYSPYNLVKKEAIALEGQPDTVDAKAAAQLVAVDERMRDQSAFYFREFSRQGSYLVDLGGRHRLVVVNTKHDSGITTNIGKVIAAYLGFGSEESQKFIAGFVNSEGFSASDLALVKRALQPETGLVIVGMHAPPLCHAGKEFSHFFRETEHPRAAIANTVDYLLRHHHAASIGRPMTEDTVTVPGPGPIPGTVRIRDLISTVLRGWRVDETPFFRKAEALDDNLGEGIADNSDAFLALCAGRQSPRKVNLVLCGHNHSNVEYRLRLDSTSNEVEYYLDHYTRNPAKYYNSREFGTGKREIAIAITPGLKTPGPLVEVREHRPGESKDLVTLRREVPPNPNALDRADDRAAWWRSRSPLIVQTPALGPIDKNQRPEENVGSPIEASFQGVRVIDVRNDVIDAVRLVTLADLRMETGARAVLEATG